MEIIINGQTVVVEKEVIETAVQQGKLEITNDDVILFAKSDYEARQKNLLNEEYKKGKIAEREMLAKDIKEKYGLNDVEGKDFDKIFETFKEKTLTEAKIAPSEKIKTLEKDIELMRNNFKTLEEEKLKIINEYSTKEKKSKIDNALFTMIPDNAVNDKFTRQDLLILFKANGYEPDLDESGKIIVSSNGEILKNKTTLEPLEVKDVLNGFIEAKGFIKTEPTPKPGDKTPKGNTSLELFYKEMEGKPQAEVMRELQKRIAEKTIVV